MAHKILSTKAPPKFLLSGAYKLVNIDFQKTKISFTAKCRGIAWTRPRA